MARTQACDLKDGLRLSEEKTKKRALSHIAYSLGHTGVFR
jgi:hypothetical protein